MDFFYILNTQFSFTSQLSLVAGFGLILGSFASLVSHRLATRQSIVVARSECTKCGAKLKVRNLIPLFSWLFQGGKCDECQEKISVRYPLIEISFAVAFLIIYFACGQKFDLRMLLFFLITTTLFVMSIVDLEHYFIPDSTQYFLAALVIILRIYDGGVNGAVDNIGSALCYTGFGLLMLGFFYFTVGIEALGIDDVKFFFIAGLLLGMSNFLFFMMIGGLIGAIFGAIWQKVRDDATFPFAPAICISLYICMLFGKKINTVELLGSLIF